MADQPITILGLESSCDETAASVVRGHSGNGEVLSSVVFDQADLHAAFGGVVPEIAARAHAEKLDVSAKQALDTAGIALSDIDGIAVTAGPGLIGGVLAGVMFAKGLCVAAVRPLLGVNHLAGQALTPRLTDAVPYPYLMLLVSGGHCQFLIVKGSNDFERLGGTIDDAPGEAFDKSARLLGLAQPGGPSIEAEAQNGSADALPFPRPMLDRPDCNLSFSGLKTAVLRQRDQIVANKGGLSRMDRANICAGFQSAVVDVLAAKTERALAQYLDMNPGVPTLAVAGGVAANEAIRTALEALAERNETAFCAPPLSLCTDNAAMIAYAGLELFEQGHRDTLDLVARPRWPLDQTSPAMLGGGKKGAKA